MSGVSVALKRGSRVFLTGFSGSGKTTFGLRLCEAMPSPLVIVDTKPSPAIRDWGKANAIRITRRPPDWSKLDRDIIYRPDADMLSRPMMIDAWLGEAFNGKYIPSIYIDEGYQVGAVANKMGKGVTGLFSRGRERGMRVLFGAQRPAWITRFVMTEADHHIVGFLPHDEDRKTMYSVTGKREMLEPMDHDFQFWYSTPGRQPPVLLKPLDIDESRDTSFRRSMKPERQRQDRRSVGEWLRDLFAA